MAKEMVVSRRGGGLSQLAVHVRNRGQVALRQAARWGSREGDFDGISTIVIVAATIVALLAGAATLLNSDLLGAVSATISKVGP